MTIKEMREYLNVSRAEFSRRYKIPVRTLENWESGKSKCPDYVIQLLERAVLEDCEIVSYEEGGEQCEIWLEWEARI